VAALGKQVNSALRAAEAGGDCEPLVSALESFSAGIGEMSEAALEAEPIQVVERLLALSRLLVAAPDAASRSAHAENMRKMLVALFRHLHEPSATTLAGLAAAAQLPVAAAPPSASASTQAAQSYSATQAAPSYSSAAAPASSSNVADESKAAALRAVRQTAAAVESMLQRIASEPVPASGADPASYWWSEPYLDHMVRRSCCSVSCS
jgi:hypothetical protein